MVAFSKGVRCWKKEEGGERKPKNLSRSLAPRVAAAHRPDRRGTFIGGCVSPGSRGAGKEDGERESARARERETAQTRCLSTTSARRPPHHLGKADAGEGAGGAGDEPPRPPPPATAVIRSTTRAMARDERAGQRPGAQREEGWPRWRGGKGGLLERGEATRARSVWGAVEGARRFVESDVRERASLVELLLGRMMLSVVRCRRRRARL